MAQLACLSLNNELNKKMSGTSQTDSWFRHGSVDSVFQIHYIINAYVLCRPIIGTK
jgi:hypothetical protein